ncbi:MAG: D-tyrosyl-tRNA(Tyr) deacylase [Phycisphaerales bacterium]|jgi:D-aminoacyl-tRNA deacylase|nr:D-tyrosyl-tRNA(Tyr) deacylase [Phycisphaerales bacterium]MBT7171999.1 D-tyrosyl-tRNA(Tyr) deacylase [Phycisphaerales bacterium]
MRALIQRVLHAAVTVDGETVGEIQNGLLVYVGIAPSDTPADAQALAAKVVNLRIFPDTEDKLNLSVKQTGGGILVVPNFTLYADARKGRRPAFNSAAPGEVAQPLTDAFAEAIAAEGIAPQTGQFGADMKIESVADGPINLMIEIPAV